jgi:hypothetical protein
MMQNPNDGTFFHADDIKELQRQRDVFLDAMEPGRRNSLQDERLWPIFRNGETVYVRNDSGAEAKCVVESIGKKQMRLRGVLRERRGE